MIKPKNSPKDDDFRARPGAPKNRHQRFVSQVLKQVAKAGGKSAVRAPAKVSSASRQGSGHRPGARLGRGHVAARFTGRNRTPNSRRVAIKTLLVNLRQASPRSVAKHLR